MQKSIFDFRKGTFYRVFFMIFCLKNSTNVYFEVQTLLKRAFVPVQTSAVQKNMVINWYIRYKRRNLKIDIVL